MVQRVTNTTMTRTLNADIQINARKLVGAQQKISSGKELQRPSDGPANVLRALDQRVQYLRRELLGMNTRQRARRLGGEGPAPTSRRTGGGDDDGIVKGHGFALV